MSRRFTSILKPGLKITVSAGALVFVFTRIDFRDILETMAASNIYLLIFAVLVFVFSKLIAAYRLNIIFRAINVELTALQNLKLYLLGMFYNLFLPGGVGGDGYKIYILSRRTDVKTTRIFWAVLLDRLNGVMAIVCLAVLLSYFITLETEMKFRWYIWAVVPVSITAFGYIVYRFFNDLYPALFRTILLSFLVQISQLFSVYLIFMAIGGDSEVFEYLLVFLVSSLVAMIPVSIGGAGLRELTFLYGARMMFLNVNMSVTLSLMFYFMTLFVSLWGIYYGIRTNEVFSTHEINPS